MTFSFWPLLDIYKRYAHIGLLARASTSQSVSHLQTPSHPKSYSKWFFAIFLFRKNVSTSMINFRFITSVFYSPWLLIISTDKAVASVNIISLNFRFHFNVFRLLNTFAVSQPNAFLYLFHVEIHINIFVCI